MQPVNEAPSTEFVARKKISMTDETELRLRQQIDALQKTCDERANILVKAHNALIPLAQWEKPVNPTAKDCILAGEIKQQIAEMIPMVPAT